MRPKCLPSSSASKVEKRQKTRDLFSATFKNQVLLCNARLNDRDTFCACMSYSREGGVWREGIKKHMVDLCTLLQWCSVTSSLYFRTFSTNRFNLRRRGL